MVNGRIADVAEVEMLLKLLLQEDGPACGVKAADLFFGAGQYVRAGKASLLCDLRRRKSEKPQGLACGQTDLRRHFHSGSRWKRTRGSMILDIGAQSTEVSVIAGDQVIVSDSLPIGGQQLNEAICNEISRRGTCSSESGRPGA